MIKYDTKGVEKKKIQMGVLIQEKKKQRLDYENTSQNIHQITNSFLLHFLITLRSFLIDD